MEAPLDPVLIVDCNLNDLESAPRFAALLGVDTVIARAPDSALPSSVAGLSGLVITGSAASVVDPEPWQDAAEDLVRGAAAAGVPVLGVCFGHQLVARALVGEHAVRHSPVPEVGWLEVEILQADPLLSGLAPIRTFVSHGDEVLPVGGIDVLARTPGCAVHALRLPGLPVWGVQFHLEMSHAEVARVVAYRAERHPELGIDRAAMMRAAVDTEAGARRLFRNFVSHVS